VLIGTCATGLSVAAAPVAAQTSYSPYAESPAAALARYVRTLASSPRDFSALIGAGRAALALGDADAAAGFFARADEINPNSPLPQAGMGAVSVANGDAYSALPYFTRAQQLGAPVASFGADRGLAYDLMGQQAQAQADYRAALGGSDADEARRRLALSLAISGKKAEALDTLAPLSAKGDAATSRIRAFVLALSGDSNGAMRAIDAAMPGSWASVAPFLQRLPALTSGQKAAAVNLGIFPETSGVAYASASPPPAFQQAPAPSSDGADRLAGIDQVLRAQPAPAQPVPSWTPPASTQMASVSLPTRQPAAEAKATNARAKKIWLQLASGPNADALPDQFQRIKSRNREMFDGIKGYVARSPDRSRLLIGPFRSSADAETFAEGLESVNAFRWTNSEVDTIVPLGS
jgi:Flp pilus assembly protein TadD